jgi:hypothetical protein
MLGALMAANKCDTLSTKNLAPLDKKHQDTGVTIPFLRSDHRYYHMDHERWAELVSHLLLESNLYKANRFDCKDYAIKAMITAVELFGLNTYRYTYGQTPRGRHEFNGLWTGNGFLLFEPNEGFRMTLDSPVFEWGENEYQPIDGLL